MMMKFRHRLFVFLLALPACELFATEMSSALVQTACADAVTAESETLQMRLQSWRTAGTGDIAGHQAAIKRIESNDGVYDNKLVAELVALGLLELEQAKQAESAAAFSRALQIIRVNEGLYSKNQLPLLDLLIESDTALARWQQVSAHYDMMHWLYRRNYADDDPRQLQALKRLRRWYMESYNKDTGRSLEELFRKSEALYEQAIRIVWECTGANERQTLCFWHKSCCAGAEPIQGSCPLDNK